MTANDITGTNIQIYETDWLPSHYSWQRTNPSTSNGFEVAPVAGVKPSPLASLADSLYSSGELDLERIHSVPDVWARPLYFEQILMDNALDNPQFQALKKDTLNQWRILLYLAATGCAGLTDVGIHTVSVPADGPRITAALGKLQPAAHCIQPDFTWSNLTIVTGGVDEVGVPRPAFLLHPVTLVAPAADGWSIMKDLPFVTATPIAPTAATPHSGQDGAEKIQYRYSFSDPIDQLDGADLLYLYGWLTWLKEQLARCGVGAMGVAGAHDGLGPTLLNMIVEYQKAAAKKYKAKRGIPEGQAMPTAGEGLPQIAPGTSIPQWLLLQRVPIQVSAVLEPLRIADLPLVYLDEETQGDSFAAQLYRKLCAVRPDYVTQQLQQLGWRVLDRTSLLLKKMYHMQIDRAAIPAVDDQLRLPSGANVNIVLLAFLPVEREYANRISRYTIEHTLNGRLHQFHIRATIWFTRRCTLVDDNLGTRTGLSQDVLSALLAGEEVQGLYTAQDRQKNVHLNDGQLRNLCGGRCILEDGFQLELANEERLFERVYQEELIDGQTASESNDQPSLQLLDPDVRNYASLWPGRPVPGWRRYWFYDHQGAWPSDNKKRFRLTPDSQDLIGDGTCAQTSYSLLDTEPTDPTKKEAKQREPEQNWIHYYCLSRFPTSLYAEGVDNAYLGALPLQRKSAYIEQCGENSSFFACIDLGTSSTVLRMQVRNPNDEDTNGDDIALNSGMAIVMGQTPANPTNGATAITRINDRDTMLKDITKYFLPAEVQSNNAPFPTLYFKHALKIAATHQNLLHGHIYFKKLIPEYGELKECSGDLLTNLKNTESELVINQLALMICLQARLKGFTTWNRLVWRVSSPISMRSADRKVYHDKFRTGIGRAMSIAGLQPGANGPAIQNYTESEAAAVFFQHNNDLQPTQLENLAIVDIGGGTTDIFLKNRVGETEENTVSYQSSIKLGARALLLELLKDNTALFKCILREAHGIRENTDITGVADGVVNSAITAANRKDSALFSHITEMIFSAPTLIDPTDPELGSWPIGDSVVQAISDVRMASWDQTRTEYKPAALLLRSLLAVNMASIFYYIGLLFRYAKSQHPDRYQSMPTVCVGGNGSRILDWIADRDNTESLLNDMMLYAFDPQRIDPKRIVPRHAFYHSTALKLEAVKGMLRQAVPMPNAQANGNAGNNGYANAIPLCVAGESVRWDDTKIEAFQPITEEQMSARLTLNAGISELLSMLSRYNTFVKDINHGMTLYAVDVSDAHTLPVEIDHKNKRINVSETALKESLKSTLNATGDSPRPGRIKEIHPPFIHGVNCLIDLVRQSETNAKR